MPPRTGLNSQIGFATETTVGVPATVTAFLPVINESIVNDKERLESEGIIANRRVLDSGQWNGGRNNVGGDIGFELQNRGMTRLFHHMFGGTPVTSGSGPYTHTYTPGELSGLSFTTQVGRPDISGVTNAFSYSGCKVSSWELSCAAGEIGTLGLSILASTEQAGSRVVTNGVTTDTDATVTSATAAFAPADLGKFVTGAGIPAGTSIVTINSATSVELSAAATATATGVTLTIGTPLATASLPAGLRVFKFNHGSVSIGGTPADVMTATISGDNGLNADRFFIGDQDRKEPLETSLRTYEGTLEMEFSSIAQYNLYLNGTEFALVLGFSNAAGDSLTITANIRYDGETPTVQGRDILTQSVAFKAVGTTDAAAITAVLVNSDSAV